MLWNNWIYLKAYIQYQPCFKVFLYYKVEETLSFFIKLKLKLNRSFSSEGVFPIPQKTLWKQIRKKWTLRKLNYRGFKTPLIDYAPNKDLALRTKNDASAHHTL